MYIFSLICCAQWINLYIFNKIMCAVDQLVYFQYDLHNGSTCIFSIISCTMDQIVYFQYDLHNGSACIFSIRWCAQWIKLYIFINMMFTIDHLVDFPSDYGLHSPILPKSYPLLAEPITKTSLFKYIESFTSKKTENFQIKI